MTPRRRGTSAAFGPHGAGLVSTPGRREESKLRTTVEAGPADGEWRPTKWLAKSAAEASRPTATPIQNERRRGTPDTGGGGGRHPRARRRERLIAPQFKVGPIARDFKATPRASWWMVLIRWC